MPEPEDHDWLRQGSTSPEDVAKSYEDWAPTYDETLAEWDYRAPADAAAHLRQVEVAGTWVAGRPVHSAL